MKMSTAFGIVVSGFALDLVGFPTGAKPGHVPQDIVTKLALFEGPAMAIFAVAAAYFYSRYRIDRARHNEISRALAERRSRPPSPAAELAQGGVAPEPA
jgi:GPH family glycoside/pentoside/hexuronide:cation symporter